MAKKKGTTYRHVFYKVGRNSPCPCGSGLKQKKCCKEKFSEIYTEVINGARYKIGE